MEKINTSYEVILTYSPIIEITGHIFECFDYYLFLRQYFKTGILFFDSLPVEHLKTMFESKYIFNWAEIEQDIFFINRKDKTKNTIVSFGKNTVVLLTDGNLESLEYNKIFLSTTKLLGFLCEDKTYSNISINKKIIYLQDYRIYGLNKNFKSYNYVKKIPFQFYKPIKPLNKNIGLMYVTFVCRKITREIIEQYHKLSGCDKTLLVVPYKIKEYDNIPNIEQVVAPLDNFFEQFDTYIYTPVKRQFDCSPRLVSECIYYGKNVYLNLDYEDLGLETRYNDAITDINKIILKNDDDILKYISKLRYD